MHGRERLLVYRAQFLTDFYKRGLETRLRRHRISPFTKVTNRILPQKSVSTGCRPIVSEDLTR